MRIQGDVVPNSFDLYFYSPDPSKVDARFRENIRGVEDPEDGTVFYAYDEYQVLMERRDDLEEYVQQHLNDYLRDLRAAEYNQNASEVLDMTDNMAELIDLIYENDLEVIG